MTQNQINIVAHRGLWNIVEEKNSFNSFSQAIKGGFGIEIDVRDLNGTLVVSHDPPVTGVSYSFESVLEFYNYMGSQSEIAINIKSDGIAQFLHALLKKYNIENYYCFDMSVPDTLDYRKRDLKYLVRVSEFESITLLSKESSGVWLDSFNSFDLQKPILEKLLKDKIKVVIVSEELHHRDKQAQWNYLADIFKNTSLNTQISICTDFPNEAHKVFNV